MRTHTAAIVIRPQLPARAGWPRSNVIYPRFPQRGHIKKDRPRPRSFSLLLYTEPAESRNQESEFTPIPGHRSPRRCPSFAPPKVRPATLRPQASMDHRSASDRCQRRYRRHSGQVVAGPPSDINRPGTDRRIDPPAIISQGLGRPALAWALEAADGRVVPSSRMIRAPSPDQSRGSTACRATTSTTRFTS